MTRLCCRRALQAEALSSFRAEPLHHVCCYHRHTLFSTVPARRVFESALERIPRKYRLRVYGYVVMPEHVHLLLSEPERETLAVAIKSLKQGVARRLIGDAQHFWQKRYYDFNTRNYRQFVEKLRYIHRIGRRESGKERQENSVLQLCSPLKQNQLEWATRGLSGPPARMINQYLALPEEQGGSYGVSPQNPGGTLVPQKDQ